MQNPNKVCKGIKTLTVDGESVAGCIVPTEKIKDGSRIVAVLG